MTENEKGRIRKGVGRKSILVKTFLNLMAVMIILILVVHVSIFFIYQKFCINSSSRQIGMDLNYVVDILKNAENYDKVLTSYAETNNVNICFKGKDQTEYYHGGEFFLDYFSERDSLIHIKGVDGMDAILFRTETAVLKDGTEAVVQLSMNLQHLKESRKIALSLLPYSLLISLVFSMFFSYFYSRKLTRPILQMSRTVRQMTDLDQKAEIGIRNDDELGTLAEHINELYRTLLQVIEDYRIKNEEVLHGEQERLNFFRAASHELKTPLAKLSILLENMRYNVGRYRDHERYLSESQTIVNDMSAMIGDILKGVKEMPAEEGVSERIQLEDLQKTAVRDSLKKVVKEYQLIARSRHLKLSLEITGDMFLKIPAGQLEKVLSNILSNAVKYCPQNGSVRIRLEEKELLIYNDAEEIPEEKLKKIWKGSYVLEDQRNEQSSGMGLFIVKSILDRYGIRFCFEAEQNGYVFRINSPM